MTDGLDQALAAAGLNLLRADPLTPALVVLDKPVPAGQQPSYVRVYTTIEWPEDPGVNNLAGVTGRAVVRWICHCVGATDEAARAVAQRVRTQLKDRRPTVAGVTSGVGLVRHEQDQPPTVDETTGVAVVDVVHVYRLTVDL